MGGGALNAATEPRWTPAYLIRSGETGDRAYVLRSWFEGARRSRWGGDVGEFFFQFHGPLIEEILDHPKTVTRVAHVVDERPAILGFAVLALAEGMAPVLHWVQVRHRCRGMGIARALLGALASAPTVHCSHWPTTAYRLPPPNFRYNPYRLLAIE